MRMGLECERVGAMSGGTGNRPELMSLLIRLEEKIDRVLRQERQEVVEASDLATLRSMTPKQHVALQMIVHGYSNKDIAEAMEVTVNTAKVHVRTIAAKLELHTRAQITKRMAPILEAVDDELYRKMSGGLPKDWGARGRFGREADPEYSHLYV